jgi:Spy/CpxP family protein refolding chaperone
MKNIKFFGLISLLLIVLISAAYCQENKGKEKIENTKERFERQTERLTKSLSLNSEQITKIKDINSKTINQLETLKESIEKNKSEKPAKKDDVKSILELRITQIREVLTPEQKEKFDKFVDKMKDKKEKHD